MIRTLLIAAALILPAAPALANAGARTEAGVLSTGEQSQYAQVFASIRGGDWSGAAARLDAMPPGPLHAAARAELYLAKGSPVVTLDQLATLIAAAPDMPKAEQLGRLAMTRGALETPYTTPTQRLVWGTEQPRRARPRGTAGDPIAASLESLVQAAIVDDQPSIAEAHFRSQEAMLGAQARTEYLQRIAWSYYLVGRDADARRLADAGRSGVGDWALQSAWVSGLAAWRMKDCNAAADAFATVGGRAGDVELRAAGHYWAARADMACGRPERVQARLRSASALRETFYGLIAASRLGIEALNYSGLHDYRDAEWRAIAGKPNVRTALGLAEIGETELAAEFVRHQARVAPTDHAALIHLAADLDLASTQFWLAHNVPIGRDVNLAARYPSPSWQPNGGWRVDRSLAYAHALQESNFRTGVVSPAGAVGLMQVRPGTAGDIARERGRPFSANELSSPSANLEYGQSYLEYLRNHPGTGGLLPKVIAAYNAGPNPIAEWNTRRFDQGDPLLYVESLPYWETRGYVPIVLRNYWVYQQQEGKVSDSRKALAQGLWPKFPGLSGPSAVRISATGNRTPAISGAQ